MRLLTLLYEAEAANMSIRIVKEKPAVSSRLQTERFHADAYTFAFGAFSRLFAAFTMV